MKLLLIFAYAASTLCAGEEKTIPVAILGGGVGAMTSAVYLERAGIDALIIEGPSPGGLITQSHAVQNWPGEIEISGPDLAEKIRKQAQLNGAHFSQAEVIGLDLSQKPYTVSIRSLDSQKTDKIHAQSIIVAMGTTPNLLHIPGEQTYWGRGVSNCAVCDGNLYKDQIVAIVGGGDAAVSEGLYLSNIAKQVHLFVRKGAFKTVEEKRLKTLLDKPNVAVHYNTVVQEVRGDGEKVTSIMTQSARKEQIPVDGLFLAIGSTPNTALLKGKVPLDDHGYIRLAQGQQTAIEGVYAIGDIADPYYKQAISAAGDGAKAAIQAQHYLASHISKAAIITPIEQPPKVVEVIEITSQEQFKEELSSSDGPVFVDFYATWCGPCKRIAPLIDTFAHQLEGKVKFLKINVDTLPQLANAYQVRSMPTAILISSDGKVLERKIGSDQISAMLSQLQTSMK